MALKIIRAWRKYVPTHGGNADLPKAEQVSCEYRTMSVGDVMKIQEDSGVDMAKLGDAGQAPMDVVRINWNLVEYVLTKYSQAWANVEIDGEPVSDSGAIVKAMGMTHMLIFGEVAGVIMSESMGAEAEEKNSAGQSEPESLGSGSTAGPALPSSSSSPETAVATG